MQFIDPAGLTVFNRYNAHVIIDSAGSIVAHYRKIHLFDVDVPNGPVLMESRTTAPGSTPVVCDSPVGKLGLTVCYDLRFPELYQRLTWDMGAQVRGPVDCWPASAATAWQDPACCADCHLATACDHAVPTCRCCWSRLHSPRSQASVSHGAPHMHFEGLALTVIAERHAGHALQQLSVYTHTVYMLQHKGNKAAVCWYRTVCATSCQQSLTYLSRCCTLGGAAACTRHRVPELCDRCCSSRQALREA